MAFFGLTALGQQDPFAAAARTSSHLHVFTISDFEKAWTKALNTAKKCNESEFCNVLRALYHGPVSSSDNERIRAFFGQCVDEVTKEEFIEGMKFLSDEADKEVRMPRGGPGASCDFATSSNIQEALLRNKHPSRTLQDKQQHPLTENQEIGWEPQSPHPPVAGRGGSEITKFAAELVKNGIYY